MTETDAASRETLVSGHNPMMGPRQLGHYVASMMEWPELQDRYDCFFEVDDIIAALIYPRDREQMLNRTFYVVRDFVASGIDLERSSIVITSQVPEFLELMLWLGSVVDQSYCDRIHRDSFTGLIAPVQRRALGLQRYASVTEVTYPQIGPAVAAIGLKATAFQGGDEITGYLEIIETIVEQFNHTYNGNLVSPQYIAPRCSFVRGTDGVHMVSGNHITLSAEPDELITRCMAVTDYSVLIHWYEILGAKDLAAGLPPSGAPSEEDRRNMANFFADRFEPFRSFKMSNADLTDVVLQGAQRTSERVAETLALVKDAMGVWDMSRLSQLRRSVAR